MAAAAAARALALAAAAAAGGETSRAASLDTVSAAGVRERDLERLAGSVGVAPSLELLWWLVLVVVVPAAVVAVVVVAVLPPPSPPLPLPTRFFFSAVESAFASFFAPTPSAWPPLLDLCRAEADALPLARGEGGFACAAAAEEARASPAATSPPLAAASSSPRRPAPASAASFLADEGLNGASPSSPGGGATSTGSP